MTKDKCNRSATVRGALFSCIICLLLAGPALLVAADIAKINLPDWLTSEDASYLAGGVEKIELSTNPGLDSIFKKSFRNNVEAEVGNHIPTKAAALVTNASIQRTAIRLSNFFWNWPCYPTTYGADHLYIPSEHAVAQAPWTSNPANDKGLAKFAAGLKGIAVANSNVVFLTYTVASSDAASCNPARSLVSRSYTAEDTAAVIDQMLEDNVTSLCTPDLSLTDYYNQFFRSDHHWRALGAAEAYNQIAASLGKTPIPTKIAPLNAPMYSGAYARNSLCLVEDEPSDLAYDFSSLKMGEAENGSEHLAYRDASEQNKHWRFYDLFYGNFDRVKGSSSGKALIICDSFGLALLRPLATGFKEVVCAKTLHSGQKTDIKLQQLIDEERPDAVIFVGHSRNYTTFTKRNSLFFESEG